MSSAAARDRRRLARPPRLPRAAEVDAQRERAARRARSSASRTSSSGSGRPSSRARWSSAGTRSACRPTASRPSRRTRAAASSTPPCSSSSTCCPSSSGRSASRREGGRLRGRRLPRRRGRAGGGARRPDARRHLRPRRVPARQRADDRPPAGQGRLRARADRPGRGPRALRRRARAGARLHRAARRPVRQAARARKGVGPKTAASLLAEYGTLEAALDGRTVLGAEGGVAALPANSDDGRLCPSPLPSRSNAQLGGGVHHSRSRGASATSPAGSRRSRR